MNYPVIKLRFVIATLLCLLLQVGWSSDERNSDQVIQEYYRLLNLANEGETGDKVALFLYTANHSGELEEYAATALEHLVEASNLGNGEASFWIGYISENGIWMDQSDQGAMIFYVLSAQQGFDKGMHASVLHFATSAGNASSEDERKLALINAQKWYDALVEIRDESESVFKSARFNYALAMLKFDPMDEYGMTLLSQAALEGHETAASMIRNLFAKTSASDYEGDDDAVRIFGLWQSTIDVIGTADQKNE